jgi:hypothetical protein
MKKAFRLLALTIPVLLFVSTLLSAQEQTEVVIRTLKDGKLIRDTTIRIEDPARAEQALKLMKIMSGDFEDMEQYSYNYTYSHDEGDHVKVMRVKVDEEGEQHKDVHVIISDDEEGEWTVIKEDMEDADEELEMIMEGAGDDDEVKVIVVKKKVDKDKKTKKQ